MKITIAYMRELERQLNANEITYSRMVEMINEKANDTPSQQSPSKSLDVEAIAFAITCAIQTKIPLSTSGKLGVDLIVTDELNKSLSQFQQPHHQYSGEIEKFTDEELKDEIKKRGFRVGSPITQQDDTSLFDKILADQPNPPASESHEKDVKSALKTTLEQFNENRPFELKLNLLEGEEKMFIDLISRFTQSTQQQKPLAVVLPDNDWIVKRAGIANTSKEHQETICLGMHEMLREILTRLSAANVVDPVEFDKWKLEQMRKYKLELNTHNTQQLLWWWYEGEIRETITSEKLLEIYLTEQSQQQNKGK